MNSPIVIEVSAMLVANTIFRIPWDGLLKTSRWLAVGIKECKGKILALCRKKREVPLVKSVLTLEISSQPGKNTRIAPSLPFSTWS